MMRLWNEQETVTYTYFPKKAPLCGKSDILIQLYRSHSISVYFQTFEISTLVQTLCGDKVPVRN